MLNRCFLSTSFPDFPDTSANLAGYLSSGGTILVTKSPEWDAEEVVSDLVDLIGDHRDVTPSLVVTRDTFTRLGKKVVVIGKIVVLDWEDVELLAELIKSIRSVLYIVPSLTETLASYEKNKASAAFFSPYVKELSELELKGELPFERVTAHREGFASVLADAIRLGVPASSSAHDSLYNTTTAVLLTPKQGVHPQDKADSIHGQRKTAVGEYDSFGFRDVLNIGRETHLLSYFAVCIATFSGEHADSDQQSSFSEEEPFRLEGTYSMRNKPGSAVFNEETITQVALLVKNQNDLSSEDKAFLVTLKSLVKAIQVDSLFKSPTPVTASTQAAPGESNEGGEDVVSVNENSTSQRAVPSNEVKSQEV